MTPLTERRPYSTKRGRDNCGYKSLEHTQFKSQDRVKGSMGYHQSLKPEQRNIHFSLKKVLTKNIHNSFKGNWTSSSKIRVNFPAEHIKNATMKPIYEDSCRLHTSDHMVPCTNITVSLREPIFFSLLSQRQFKYLHHWEKKKQNKWVSVMLHAHTKIQA